MDALDRGNMGIGAGGDGTEGGCMVLTIPNKLALLVRPEVRGTE